MTIKHAALRQPTSQEQPPLPDPAHDDPKADVLGAGALSVISDEVLRHRIRAIIEEQPKASKLKRLFDHPLAIGLIIATVGFALTGIVGGLLTNYYTVRQQELASQRSFTDELNKIQVQKIGEVWEQVDKNEVLIDGLLEKPDRGHASAAQRTENAEAVSSLIKEDRLVISKNRFWLGEQYYRELQRYLDKNKQTALNVLLADPNADLEPIINERNLAKKDILQIRESMNHKGQTGK